MKGKNSKNIKVHREMVAAVNLEVLRTVLQFEKLILYKKQSRFNISTPKYDH